MLLTFDQFATQFGKCVAVFFQRSIHRRWKCTKHVWCNLILLRKYLSMSNADYHSIFRLWKVCCCTILIIQYTNLYRSLQTNYMYVYMYFAIGVWPAKYCNVLHSRSKCKTNLPLNITNLAFDNYDRVHVHFIMVSVRNKACPLVRDNQNCCHFTHLSFWLFFY